METIGWQGTGEVIIACDEMSMAETGLGRHVNPLDI